VTLGESAAAVGMGDSGLDPAIDEESPGPVRELFADRNFRNFYIAQVLYMAANGTLRARLGRVPFPIRA
jgi:hypothetical protein